MGLFDALQNLIGGASDLTQGSLGDIVGGITENQALQDIQEQVTSVTDGATESANSVTEQGQTVVDDITQNLGL